MRQDHDESFAKLESALDAGLRRAGSDSRAAVLAVADEVARDLRSSGAEGAAMLSTISALADGAARGTADAGADVGRVAEGFMIGAMRGARETPDRSLTVIGHAADSFVRHAWQAGYEAGAVARGLAEGAAAQAAGCGLGAAEAAFAAARGAVGAADDLSPRIGRKVRAAVGAAPIAGARIIVEDSASPRVGS